MIRFLLSSWLILCIVMSASVAAAKTRIAVIDITSNSKYSKRIAPTLKKAINKRKDVTLIESNVSKRLRKHKLTGKVLGSSKLRKRNRKRFKRGLGKEDFDGLVIIEALSKGKKVRVTVIGQSGSELTSSTTSTKRKKLSSKRAKAIAANVVKLIRGDMPTESKPDTKTDTKTTKTDTKTTTKSNASTSKKTADVSAKDDPIIKIEEPDTPSVLEGGFVLSAGLIFGRRNLLSIDAETELTHVAPYLGPMAHVAFSTLLLENKAQFGIEGFFSWSPFSTENVDETGETQQLSSRVLRGGANLYFNYALANIFAAGLSGGVDYLSIGIEDNPTYIGHDYTIARVGLQVLIKPIEQLLLVAGGGFLPFASFAYGANSETVSASTTGFDARAGIVLSLGDNLKAQLNYNLTRLSPSDDDPAETTDTIHQGNLLVGWQF